MWGSRIAALVGVVVAAGALAAPAGATKYVALGDSYSAGTGTGGFYEPGCERSVRAYPHLLHEAHPDWAFVDATCSGARTGDLLATQVRALSADTDWVTYTIGGNDAGFAEVIGECALPWWAADCEGAIDRARRFIREILPARLDLVNASIRARAPRARVIALDYPRLFNGSDCSALTWFGRDEMARLNETAELARDTIAAAAARAGAGFVFVDVISAFAAHAICDGGGGSQTEWINGLAAPLGESFHPKVSGHAGGYYPVVERAITG